VSHAFEVHFSVQAIQTVSCDEYFSIGEDFSEACFSISVYPTKLAACFTKISAKQKVFI
jgi:hypothetical protein